MLAFDSPWWVITAIFLAASLRAWWANIRSLPERVNQGLIVAVALGAIYGLATVAHAPGMKPNVQILCWLACAAIVASFFVIKYEQIMEWRAGLLELADSILIALLLVFCILRPFVIQAFFIPSGSMENTLLINDRILVNKFIYFFEEPRHGDIVVFRAPHQADPGRKDFIKRLMGLPGDRICVHEGKVFRNGQPLDEPYFKEPPMYNWPVIGRDEFAPGVLQDKSNGGREWEGILEDGLPGRVGEVLVPKGSVLVMGDNRNDSNDSTKWHESAPGPGLSSPFVPRENVLGQAKLIFWPLTRLRMLH